jgi:hypothetical protein
MFGLFASTFVVVGFGSRADASSFDGIVWTIQTVLSGVYTTAQTYCSM